MTRSHYLSYRKLVLGLLVGFLIVQPAAALDTRSWDQQIASGRSRFQVLRSFDNAAVLDKETQLVWEQSPRTTTHEWSAARSECTGRTVGGRMGWRLPSVHELASLVDPSVATPGPPLPPGHPFTDVQSAVYWSATTDAENATSAWGVQFISNGSVSRFSKPGTLWAWCVRGAMNADQY